MSIIRKNLIQTWHSFSKSFLRVTIQRKKNTLLLLGMLMIIIFSVSSMATMFTLTNTLPSPTSKNADNEDGKPLKSKNVPQENAPLVRDLRRGRYWEEGKSSTSFLTTQSLSSSVTNGSTVRAGELIEISGRVQIELVPGDPTFNATPVGQLVHVYIGSETDPNKKITANDTIINQYWPNGPAVTNGTDQDNDGVPDDPDNPNSQPWVSSSAGYFTANFTFPDQNDWPKFGITAGSPITIYFRYEENQTLKNIGSPIANSGNHTIARLILTASSTGTIIEDQTSPFQGITSQQKRMRPGENASGKVRTVDEKNSPLPNVNLNYQLRNRTNNQVLDAASLHMIITIPTQTDANGIADIRLNTTLQTPTGDYSLEVIANYTSYTLGGTPYFGTNYDGENESTNNAIVQLNFSIISNYDTISMTVNVNPEIAELNESNTETVTNITVSVDINSYWSSIGTYQVPNLIVNITITDRSSVPQGIAFDLPTNGNRSTDNLSVSIPTDSNGNVQAFLRATFPQFFGPGDAIINFTVTVINPEGEKLSPDGTTPPQQPHAWIEPSKSMIKTASIHPDYNVGSISIQSLPKNTLRPGESINITYQVTYQNNTGISGIRVYLNTSITIPGVTVVPYTASTDNNGFIVFNVTTTYGVTPEDPNGILLTFDVIADFENDSLDFLIGENHAGTSTFTEYNKTWSTKTTSMTIKAIYNFITVDVSINDTNPRPGDVFLVTFTLKNGTSNLVGYDLQLLVSETIVSGPIAYTKIVKTGTSLGGNAYNTSNGKLILEYSTTYPGTDLNAKLNISVLLTNASLKTAFPISDPILRWNVGKWLNSSGGNTDLTRGSYSNNSLIVTFDPQYRIADVSATFTPNPSPANTTVTVQATVFLQNGGERVPGVNVTLVPDPSIPPSNITMITTSGLTDNKGIVTLTFNTSNTYLLDARTYTFSIIVDLENDTSIEVLENNGKRVNGTFINGTSNDGRFTNKTFDFEVIWINTTSIVIDSITDSSNADARNNGTDFIAYRQTSNFTITTRYIAQDGSPIPGQDIRIQLYKDQTFIMNLTTVTTNASGAASTTLTLPNTIGVGRFKFVPIPIGVTNSQFLSNNQSFVVRSALNITNLQVTLNGNSFSAYFVGNKLDISGYILDDVNQRVNTTTYPSHANNLLGKVKVQLVDGSNPSTAITLKQDATFDTTTGQLTFNDLQIPTSFTGSSMKVNISIETNPSVDLFKPLVISSQEIIKVYQDISWTSVHVIFNNGSSQTIVSNNSQVHLVGYTSRVFSIDLTLKDNHGRSLTTMTVQVTWKSISLQDTTDNSGFVQFNDPNSLTFSGLTNDTGILGLQHVLPNGTILSINTFVINLTFTVFDNASPTLSSDFENNSFQSITTDRSLVINATIQDPFLGDNTSTGVANVSYIFRDASGTTLFTVNNPLQNGDNYAVIITLSNKSLFQGNEEIHLIIQATDNAGNTLITTYVFYVDFTAPSRISLDAMNVTSSGYILPDTPLGNTFSINITINDPASSTTQKAVTIQQSEGILDISSLSITLQNDATSQQLILFSDYNVIFLSQNGTAIRLQIIFYIDAIKNAVKDLPPDTLWEVLINISDNGGNYPSSLLSANITFRIDQTAPDTETLEIQPAPVQSNNQDSYFVNNTESLTFQNVTILDGETGVANVTLTIDFGNDTQIITFTKIGPHSWAATQPISFSNVTTSTRLTGTFEFVDYLNNTATHQIVFVVSVTAATTTPTTPTTPTTETTAGTNVGTASNPIVDFFISLFMIFGSAVAGVATARLVEILRQRFLASRRSLG